MLFLTIAREPTIISIKFLIKNMKGKHLLSDLIFKRTFPTHLQLLITYMESK